MFTMDEWSQKQDAPQWRIYGFFVIGILALISIVLLIQNDIWEKNKADNTQDQPDNIVTPQINRADPEKITEGFPKGLVLNSKIEIVGSYSATYPNSSAQQATVEFVSSKSSGANFTFYTKWAKDNGWNIVNLSEDDLISTLYFKKVAEKINITIQPSATIAGGSKLIVSYVNSNQ